MFVRRHLRKPPRRFGPSVRKADTHEHAQPPVEYPSGKPLYSTLLKEYDASLFVYSLPGRYTLSTGGGGVIGFLYEEYHSR